ncbi:hypothetical protein ACWIVU_10120, partial [Ursidibacter arcticus]
FIALDIIFQSVFMDNSILAVRAIFCPLHRFFAFIHWGGGVIDKFIARKWTKSHIFVHYINTLYPFFNKVRGDC